MTFSIRKASKNDIPAILSLVHELAVYEKAPHEVINTVDQMTEDGFGKNPLFYCYVAEAESQIIGFALYYYRYSTWKGKVIYLEDLYVQENMRQLGVGKALFGKIIEVAQEENCQRVSWQVLEWNTPAIKFYEKFKAGFDPEWWNGYVELR
jgi:GNAT superfamily N-acetyltransferase